MSEKLKFKRKRPKDHSISFPSTQVLVDPVYVKKIETDKMIYDWALNTPIDEKPFTYMTARLGMSESEARQCLNAVPASEWQSRRKAILDVITAKSVKRHIDQIVDMNDKHIAASKLGMAKAIEFMSRMRIEEKLDKRGRPFFSGFRPSDLRSCMEAIERCQKIQRMALGLSTEEGSINIWQNIQNNLTVNSDSVEGQVEALEKDLSYEEIRAMIDAERKAKQLKSGDIIDVQASQTQIEGTKH